MELKRGAVLASCQRCLRPSTHEQINHHLFEQNRTELLHTD